jgi:hypothetical protein
MKTAVEWLVNELRNGKEFNDELIEQAKEMEKEQIINSREDGFLWGMRNTNNFYADKVIESEQYYNETFKQQEL